MSEHYIIYRGFKVYPFKDNGIIVSLKGHKEFISKGARYIYDSNNIQRNVSHIIFAAGYFIKYKQFISYKKLKNYIITFKDGNKLFCNFYNLQYKYKKRYKKQIKKEKELCKYLSSLSVEKSFFKEIYNN